MKEIAVQMILEVEDDKTFDEIKKWEHHIDYALDLDSYPEIKNVKDVSVYKLLK